MITTWTPFCAFYARYRHHTCLLPYIVIYPVVLLLLLHVSYTRVLGLYYMLYAITCSLPHLPGILTTVLLLFCVLKFHSDSHLYLPTTITRIYIRKTPWAFSQDCVPKFYTTIHFYTPPPTYLPSAFCFPHHLFSQFLFTFLDRNWILPTTTQNFYLMMILHFLGQGTYNTYLPPTVSITFVPLTPIPKNLPRFI